MKSTLVFCDSYENSKRGTLRGLVIFPIYIIIILLWVFMTKSTVYKNIDKVSNFRIILSLIITGVLIVSILGVNTSSTQKIAITYGALVGFVIYGISNVVLLAVFNKWEYTTSIIDTIWGIVSTAFLSYILYIIINKWPDTFQFI